MSTGNGGNGRNILHLERERTRRFAVDEPSIFAQAPGDPGTAAINADQRRPVVKLRTQQIGQALALGLGVRQRVGQG